MGCCCCLGLWKGNRVATMDIGAWLANMGVGGGPGPVSGSGAKEPIKVADDAGGSHFPHVHAASALAAAVDAPAKGARVKPEGMFLAADSVVDVDAPRSSGDSQPQLQVSPITVVKTDYRLQMMHQIAVNSTYICYGLKQGHIRALNKNTAGRVLFKDHSSMVVDMRFFSAGSNLLASCDQSGEVVVRKIFEDGEGEEAAPIQHELLVRHCLQPAPAATRRLAWHPQLESLLAVATQDRVGLVNVPPTSGVASSPEFASPALPAGPMTDGAITTLAFCDRGDMLAVADDKGFVYVWALDSELLAGWEAGGSPLEALPMEADVKFRAFEDGQYVASLDFLPSRDDGEAGGAEEAAQAVLLVGDATCQVLRLWSVDVEAKPQRTSSLQLVSSAGGPDAFFNHMLLQPNFDAVVLANAKGKQVYVVHVQQDGSGGAHFNHFAGFSVTQPILSMTTTTELSFEEGSEVFHLYTVQTEGIQQYTLFPETCLPEEEGGQEEYQVEGGVSAELHAAPPALTEHVREAAAAADALGQPPSVQLMSPADVLNSGWGSGTAEHPRAVQEAVQPVPPSFVTQHALQHASSNASDAASPYRPQDAEQAAPGKARTASVAPGGPLLQLLQSAAAAPQASAGTAGTASAFQGLASSTSVHSDHGSSGYPATGAAAHARGADGEPAPHVSEVERASVAAAVSPVSAERPMPPQPTTLVKKLSAASPVLAAAATQAAAARLESASLPTPAPPSAVASDAGAPEAGDEAVAGLLAPGIAAFAGRSDVNGGDGHELSKVLALQQQLLSQLAFTQRETVKQLRAELVKTSKASETATAKAVEAALKAHAKQVEQDRAKEVRKEREELAKLLQASAAGIVKDVASRVQDASRATVNALSSSVATAVSKALGEALPAALGSGATQQALEQALGSQLRTALPRAMADSFAGSVIPAFERATQTMFNQVDAALTTGLTEHLSAARSSNAEMGSAVKEATAQLEAAVKQLGSAAAALTAAAAGPGAQGGAGEAAGSRSAAGKSGAISLAELEARRDPRTAITSQLASGDYQAAFTTALNTGNADTTMWLCKQLAPGQVFDRDPCPLAQEVILSLITHLAYQIQTTDTEVKLSWLVEAAPAIDPRNPKVAEHCRQVLEPIKAQLTQVARTLSGEAGRLAKTAVHVINSLLHQ